MKRTFRVIVCGFLFSAFLVAQPYRLVVVRGESMSPTYGSNQIVLAKRGDSEFERGQAVVFTHDGETLVKRVAFVPGDRILEYKFLGSWHVPINDFLLARIRTSHCPVRYLTIPSDHLFVMGDNAGESVDSRVFGPIPTSSVFAKVADAPRPQMIQGFAGAAEVVPGTSDLVVRRLPMSRGEIEAAKRLSDRASAN